MKQKKKKTTRKQDKMREKNKYKAQYASVIAWYYSVMTLHGTDRIQIQIHYSHHKMCTAVRKSLNRSQK
jgi:hypothetical protein